MIDQSGIISKPEGAYCCTACHGQFCPHTHHIHLRHGCHQGAQQRPARRSMTAARKD
jgi:hypothetical protein